VTAIRPDRRIGDGPADHGEPTSRRRAIRARRSSPRRVPRGRIRTPHATRDRIRDRLANGRPERRIRVTRNPRRRADHHRRPIELRRHNASIHPHANRPIRPRHRRRVDGAGPSATGSRSTVLVTARSSSCCLDGEPIRTSRHVEVKPRTILRSHESIRRLQRFCDSRVGAAIRPSRLSRCNTHRVAGIRPTGGGFCRACCRTSTCPTSV
jgi:hypothetical protein